MKRRMTRSDEDGKRNLVREMRAEVVSDEKDGGKKFVRVSVSSEEPYLRDWMWDPVGKKAIRGYEVLGHNEGEIDFSRMKDGLVIQDGHYGKQIGIIDAPTVKDGKLGGVVRFGHSQDAKDAEADALDGIRKNMSVGYIVHEYKLVGEKDGEPVYRAVKWTPYEGSFVNVPADTQVGVGRSVEETETKTAAKPAAVKSEKGIQIMDHPEVKAGITPAEVVECFRLAKSANMEHAEVDGLIKSGKPFAEIREELEKAVEKHVDELAQKAAKPALPPSVVAPALSEEAKREVDKRYSLTNVIRHLAGEKVDVGFELEMSREIEKNTQRVAQGILIPDQVRSTDGQETLARPAHGTVDGLGGDVNKLIETNLLAGNFIEALRNTLVLRRRAGVGVITGLVGNIAIPKEGNQPTAAWITQEFGDATKTNPTFGQITATPHSCGAYVDITRQALIQSSFPLQAFVQRRLLEALAYALETAAFNGSGSSGVPAGIIGQISESATKDWEGAPTFNKIVELMAVAKKANAYNPSFRFIGDTDVWQKLATTRDYQEISDSTNGVVAAVGGQNRLLDIDTDKVLGREFIESHLLPENKLIFGDFSQMLFGLWSGTDLLVDQYSNSTKGSLRIVAFQDSDVIVRRPESFALATNVVTNS